MGILRKKWNYFYDEVFQKNKLEVFLMFEISNLGTITNFCAYGVTQCFFKCHRNIDKYDFSSLNKVCVFYKRYLNI